MKNTSFIAFLIPLSSLCLAQTVPLRWTAELGDARPARFTLVHGDTVELAADLFAEGRPYLPATADASLLWQTNGMGALWWEVPAFVASNRVSATWTPAMDTGAASYLAHFRVGSSTGSVFRAYARLAMQHGPGDPPNALPLPVPFIDFAKVAVTNEPWSASSGLTTNDVRAIVEADAGPTNKLLHADSSGALKMDNGNSPFPVILSGLADGETTGGLKWDTPGFEGYFVPEAGEMWTWFMKGKKFVLPIKKGGTVTHPAEIATMAEVAAVTNGIGSAAYRNASDFATAADEALVYQLITNRLSSVTFDFATVAGLYLAISNIVAAQGGTITNFPAIP